MTDSSLYDPPDFLFRWRDCAEGISQFLAGGGDKKSIRKENKRGLRACVA
jgi:hypothetical protein